MDRRRYFEPVPRTVREARRFVGSVVETWSLPIGDAELLVSELATNAVVHARTPYEVAVTTIEPHGIRVEVTDDDPNPPEADLDTPTDSLGGRGMHLVVQLSKRWGCESIDGGKTVWFEL